MAVDKEIFISVYATKKWKNCESVFRRTGDAVKTIREEYFKSKEHFV